MAKKRSIKDILKHPRKIFYYAILETKFSHLLSDKMCLKLRYRKNFRKKLNLKNPRTFNEKLQWLKLHDRKPEYTKMVDKYEAKKYVAEVLGGGI